MDTEESDPFLEGWNLVGPELSSFDLHPEVTPLPASTGAISNILNRALLEIEVDLDDDGWGQDSTLDQNPAGDTETVLELGSDEDVPEEWCDGSGFINANWIMDQTALEATLNVFGLTGERLALQSGEEKEVLEQLLAHLQLEIDPRQKAFHLRQIKNSVKLAMQLLPMQKRLRGDSAPVSLQRIQDATAAMSKARTQESQKQSGWDHTDFRLPPKGRRRQTLLLQQFPGTSKAALEDRQKADIVDQVITILELAEAPIVQAGAESQHPRRTVIGAVGASRTGTMISYVRAFKSFLEFLFISFGKRWPDRFTQVTDYLHCRGDEPCPPSVPQVFMQALAWFEKTGGFAGSQSFSKLDSVKRTVDYIIEKVSTGAPPLRQAPRLPAVMVASLELYVTNQQHATGFRLKAFSELLKTFGTLREDDIQHLPPSRIRIIGELVISELTKTKTSGKTKRVKELPLAIWAGSAITGSTWLEQGMVLLGDFGDPGRDHVLPSMSADGVEATDGPLAYGSSLALLQRLVGELKKPVFSNGSWKESDDKLFHPGLKAFFTEHSARAVLPSILAVLEEDKLRVDYLGRWSPSGSQDYTRTFRSVVKSLQKKAVQAMRGADSRLDDADLIDRLNRYCDDRELSEAERGEVLGSFKEALCGFEALLKTPAVKEWARSLDDDLLSGNIGSAVGSEDGLTKIVKKQSALKQTKSYLIVYSAHRSFARLHRVTGSNCPWVRTQIRDCMEVDKVDSTMYNARCKICWPSASAAEEESVSSLSN